MYGHHPQENAVWQTIRGYGADFYLAGHEHDKYVAKKDDVDLIVCGTGGRFSKIDELGPCHFSFSGDQATLKFIGIDGKTDWQKTYTKGGGNPSPGPGKLDWKVVNQIIEKIKGDAGDLERHSKDKNLKGVRNNADSVSERALELYNYLIQTEI